MGSDLYFLQCVILKQEKDFHYGFLNGNRLPLFSMPVGINYWRAQSYEGDRLFAHQDRNLQGVRYPHQPIEVRMPISLRSFRWTQMTGSELFTNPVTFLGRKVINYLDGSRCTIRKIGHCS